MGEVLLPRTDAGALAQVVGAAVACTGALIAVRRNRNLMWFLGGLVTLTLPGSRSGLSTEHPTPGA